MPHQRNIQIITTIIATITITIVTCCMRRKWSQETNSAPGKRELRQRRRQNFGPLREKPELKVQRRTQKSSFQPIASQQKQGALWSIESDSKLENMRWPYNPSKAEFPVSGVTLCPPGLLCEQQQGKDQRARPEKVDQSLHPIRQGLPDILSQKRNTQMTKIQTKQKHKHREQRAMTEKVDQGLHPISQAQDPLDLLSQNKKT